ncbi:hypothetical protein ABTC25_18360, partial [Acinetobacter baumannii]
QTPGKIVTLPAPTNTTTGNGGNGKIVTLPVTNNGQNGGPTNTGINGTPGKIVSMPVNIGRNGPTGEVKTIGVKPVDAKPVNVQTQTNPTRITNGV